MMIPLPFLDSHCELFHTSHSLSSPLLFLSFCFFFHVHHTAHCEIPLTVVSNFSTDTDSSLSKKKERDNQQHKPSASYFRLHDAMNEANRNNMASKIVTMGETSIVYQRYSLLFVLITRPSSFFPPPASSPSFYSVPILNSFVISVRGRYRCWLSCVSSSHLCQSQLHRLLISPFHLILSTLLYFSRILPPPLPPPLPPAPPLLLPLPHLHLPLLL